MTTKNYGRLSTVAVRYGDSAVKGVQAMSKNDKTINNTKHSSKEELILSKFKTPKEPVKTLYLKTKPCFSSRSEAIRSTMRTFFGRGIYEGLTCEDE